MFCANDIGHELVLDMGSQQIGARGETSADDFRYFFLLHL
jgi:hypothetical protein